MIVAQMLIPRTDPESIERDRWGRPVVDGTTYTRVTTLAGMLGSKDNLINWASEVTARGLAMRPDLVTAAYAARNDKKKLREIAAAAKEAGGGGSGATVGTALHAILEELDRGELDLDDVPDPGLKVLAGRYLAAMRAADFTVAATEFFIVYDELFVAGTADRLVRTADGRYRVADLKTSDGDTGWLLGPTSMQLAAYSHGRPWGGEWPPGFDPSVGVLLHVPQSGGPIRIVDLDLEHGLDGLRLASSVRDWRDNHRTYVSVGI